MDGRRLPNQGKGFRHLGDHPFGTEETIQLIQYAAWVVDSTFPISVPILVGDLSGPEGGYLLHHQSHQSGRDVDIGIYTRGTFLKKRFEEPTEDELDLEKTWLFIVTLLETSRIQYIFLDKSLQTLIYHHAVKKGWQRTILSKYFQYPGNQKQTIIRHVSDHRDHLHIRFLCPDGDLLCRN